MRSVRAHRDPRVDSTVHTLLSFVFVVLMPLTHTLAMWSDPGYSTASAHQFAWSSSGLRECVACATLRDARSKHCKVCDRCVDAFDHHCPLLGNCVGLANRRWFLLFLIVHAFATAFGAWNQSMLLHRYRAHVFSPWAVPHAILLFYCVTLGGPFVGFTLFHLTLLLTQHTTYELVRGKRVRTHGVVAELRAFLQGSRAFTKCVSPAYKAL